MRVEITILRRVPMSLLFKIGADSRYAIDGVADFGVTDPSNCTDFEYVHKFRVRLIFGLWIGILVPLTGRAFLFWRHIV